LINDQTLLRHIAYGRAESIWFRAYRAGGIRHGG
jgi:hypothetical protein